MAHMTHTEEILYKCKLCNKIFPKKNDERNSRSELGEKTYQYCQCDKTFANKIDHEPHFMTHTSEKPHQCSQCDKTFTRKYDLNRHNLTHTGEKRHQCSHCDKKIHTKE
ncbi:unnamed protein product [Meganyctiphanes norvegica]|uniref:C2H2-type domain-containing protein n=1 Tax=Meganyctiphanes norvegica TaxID=48144 RepID=A0AAV2PZ90_MEGNR